MHTVTNAGRWAGAIYFLSAAAAGVPLIYVPGSVIVEGDAAATSHHILLSEHLLRACIASELLGALLLVAVVRILFQLLHGTNDRLARLMVTLVLLSVPITFVGVLTEFAALDLARGSTAFTAISQAQRDALAMLCLDLHSDGVSLANIFWGLWLLPFGLLVVQSRALPRLLGYWLVVDGSALVAVSMTSVLLPAWIDVVNKAAIPAELGELVTMVWLVVMGARPRLVIEAKIADVPGGRNLS